MGWVGERHYYLAGGELHSIWTYPETSGMPPWDVASLDLITKSAPRSLADQLVDEPVQSLCHLDHKLARAAVPPSAEQDGTTAEDGESEGRELQDLES